ncbi:MAG: PAS domain S-box protein, partial [Isosphaeraceae bacterium]
MTIKQARGSETFLHNFAESLPHIAWVAQSDGVPVYFNQRWYDYTGLNQERFARAGWIDVLHTDDVAPTLARWKHAIETGLAQEIE